MTGPVALGHLLSRPMLGFHRPLLEPLRVDNYWLLLLPPLVVAICIAYKTIKLNDLTNLPREASYLAVQILAFTAMAAAMLWLLTELV
jgi:hypothetical protein